VGNSLWKRVRICRKTDNRMDEPWFDPRLVCMRVIVYNLALREMCPEFFGFLPSVSFHQCTTLTLILILL